MITVEKFFSRPKGWALLPCPRCQSLQPVLVLYQVLNPKHAAVEGEGGGRRWGWCNYCEQDFGLEFEKAYDTVDHWDPVKDPPEDLAEMFLPEGKDFSNHLTPAKLKAVLDCGAQDSMNSRGMALALLLGAFIGPVVLTSLSYISYRIGWGIADVELGQHIFCAIFGIIPGVIGGIVVHCCREHPEEMLGKTLYLCGKNGISYAELAEGAKSSYPKFHALLTNQRNEVEKAIQAAATEYARTDGEWWRDVNKPADQNG